MTNNVKHGLLDGKQEIMDFLGCSEHKLMKYIRAGMPVRIDEGRWLAHTWNIDLFFREYTWPNKTGGRKIHKTPLD